ncbi:MAG: phage terminase small subunit P27 family [Rhodobacteraceae bacterium]|nr:phage terminase small subunit P27 family [Paracoccaceae bacterium]MBR25469.1 phage terminase small subunit P27 family [Paracoccaceae bacterium]
MTRGRRPKPTALKRAAGNPGKRALNHAEPQPPEGLPTCPPHLSDVAREEWDRVARVLYEMGVLTVVDRAGLAACSQAYERWVEAEEKLAQGPALVKTPSGYVQQSPWMGIANKQLELMGRYMTEFGMTPASRSRIAALDPRMEAPKRIEVKWLSSDRGSARERLADELDRRSRTITVELDEGDASVL